MLLIKYILLLLSVFQLIPLEDFWRTEFVWFFVWIIFFHVDWFYLDNKRYKKINCVVLCLLAFINIVVLPVLPVMMLGLLAIDLRQNYNRKMSIILISILSLGIMTYWIMTSSWPASEYLVYTLAMIILSFFIMEQYMLVKNQESQLYNFKRRSDELESHVISLKSQMIAMEEIHTLNERNRISRDLHDSVGHTLSTLVIQLAAIAKLTEDSAPEASEMLTQLHQFSKEGLANVRQVIHELKPQHYRKIAFIEQVHNIISDFELNSSIRVYFNNNQLLWELSPEQEVVFIRAIQEFLSNSNKHSGASEVRIQCHFTDSSVILTMTDNGRGTDEIKPQMGMTGMKERTKLLGGKVQVQSSINKGFKVRIVLPKGGHLIGR